MRWVMSGCGSRAASISRGTGSRHIPSPDDISDYPKIVTTCLHNDLQNWQRLTRC
jgi:hypothetical protein